MINVQISTGSGVKHILSIDTPLAIRELERRVEDVTNFSKENFYVVRNGRLANGDDICSDGFVTVVPRLLGGKGGFGSMLRAIGAQIEKTTNREACRDLSGRRIRDINEEKRLKAWIEKQSKRDEEAAERKKKKLERLCAQPKHEFKDQSYERERSELTERVGSAVEEGFKAAVAGGSGIKRKVEEDVKPNKRKTLLDLDFDSDEIDTSDDSGEEEIECEKVKEEQTSNDSGHSSDENNRVNEHGNKTESEYSEASSDNHIGDASSNKTENVEEKSAATESLVAPTDATDECPKVKEAEKN